MMGRPFPALGTMNFGPSAQVKKTEAMSLIKLFVESMKTQGQSHVVLDTARIYQMGKTEELLGEVLAELVASQPTLEGYIHVHTKASPYITALDETGLRKQLDESLKALNLAKVQVYYLHQPDMKTPLEETLRVCNELHKEGKFDQLGLSNFAAWDVCRAFYLCKEKGYVLPTVYQGCYNALNRSVEAELIPAAKTLNMQFFAFNPLAAGVLCGRYNKLDDLIGAKTGRFSPEFDFVPKSMTEHPMKGKGHLFYQQRYGNKPHMDAIQVIKQVCDENKVCMVEAAFAWCIHHSYMDGNDALIFGASSIDQLKQNLRSFEEDEPMKQECLEALNAAHSLTGPVAESYMKGYGSAPGKSDVYLKVQGYL